MDDMDRIQREVYPAFKEESLAGVSRFATGGSTLQPNLEKRHWDLELVLAHMAEYSAVRHADRKGRVSVYNRPITGRTANHASTFMCCSIPWIAKGFHNRRVHYAVRSRKKLTRDRIMKLQVTEPS